MKKTLSFVFAATVAASTLFSKEKHLLPTELEREVKQVIQLTDLSPQMTKELFEGKYPDAAIECREGTDLPFQYIGNFGLFSTNFAPNLSVKMEKTCYFRFVKKYKRNGRSSSVKRYISFDLKNWEKASNFGSGDKVAPILGMSEDNSHVLIETHPETPTE